MRIITLFKRTQFQDEGRYFKVKDVAAGTESLTADETEKELNKMLAEEKKANKGYVEPVAFQIMYRVG